MLSFQEAIQRTLYTVLSAVTYTAPDDSTATLTVYDQVPQAADAALFSAFPYATIGNIAQTELNTDTEHGSELTLDIHLWSRYNGKLEIQRMWQAIMNALHRQEQSLAVTDYHAVYVEFDNGETLLDPDGATHHGIMVFRVYLDQTDGVS